MFGTRKKTTPFNDKMNGATKSLVESISPNDGRAAIAMGSDAESGKMCCHIAGNKDDLVKMLSAAFTQDEFLLGVLLEAAVVSICKFNDNE